jgi:pimeloyl-ACP methyl ester carboxylesterase
MLNYLRTGGDGPILVLIHGLGASSQVWDPVASNLAERYDVISLDLPGHGASPRLAPGADASPAGLASSVVQLLAEHDVERAHLVGSSLGGWVSLELALRGCALSVTALAPAGLWSSNLVPVVAHANRWLARVTEPVAPVLLKARPLRALGFWTSSTTPEALDRDLAVNAARAQASASGWAAAMEATHDNQCNVREIDPEVPVTVVWGDRDRILPAPQCQEPTGLPAHARWVRLSNCGHMPAWDQPARTLQLIDETVACSTIERDRPISMTA